MNTHTSAKYKPGDRVIALRWPRNRGGVVVKFAPKRMLVRWDGLTEDTRTSTADLRPETAEDVGLRVHAEAVRAWKARQPQIAHVAVLNPTMWGSMLPNGVQLNSVLRTPESMREASAELLQLADWFAESPDANAR
jgi:hypothetical protein